MIIPKRHLASYFDLTNHEKEAMSVMLQFVKQKIEDRFQSQKEKSFTIVEPGKTKSYTLEQKRTEHGNAYVSWDDEADKLLCRMYDEGKSIDLLSDIFERTKGAIRSRLKKLGKIQ